VKSLRYDYAACVAVALAGRCILTEAVRAAELTGAGPGSGQLLWLLGDWDGARTRLRSAIVDFQLGYVGETAGNATGGLRRQVAYADQWAVGASLDLGTLGVVTDGRVQVTITDRNGSNLE
jgi:porin